jgi:hypothetical protein
MKQQQRVYLTHLKMPALVHGIFYLLTLTLSRVSRCLLPVISFAGNTSGGSDTIVGYPFSGHVNSGGAL